MIVREPESNFIPAPAGVHAAVCVDEIDLGMVENKFSEDGEMVHKVRLVWQLAEDMKNGEPYLIRKDYRASLHEKAVLRKDLESWRGRAFTFQELAGFELGTIIGAPCMMNIVHKTGSKGGTFANIAAIMPLPQSMTKLEPRDYIRMKDRVPATTQREEPPPFDDSDVPF
jgi:hypothetical protein